LSAAGSHVEEDEPHKHDVELEVHADHSDEDVEPEESDIEVVHSTIKFSDLYSESAVDQMSYDLRREGFLAEKSESDDSEHTHDHVESDDPHLDGGVLLDPEHTH
jgi:hypothetical protein